MKPQRSPANFDLIAKPLREASLNSKETTEVNFDLISRPYRWLEYLTFGPTLQRCRTHFIPAVADKKSALVLGDGDGRFLAALLAANPHLEADAIDTSATMLHLLERRVTATTPNSNLRTHQTSALTFTPAAPLRPHRDPLLPRLPHPARTRSTLHPPHTPPDAGGHLAGF